MAEDVPFELLDTPVPDVVCEPYKLYGCDGMDSDTVCYIWFEWVRGRRGPC